VNIAVDRITIIFPPSLRFELLVNSSDPIPSTFVNILAPRPGKVELSVSVRHKRCFDERTYISFFL